MSNVTPLSATPNAGTTLDPWALAAGSAYDPERIYTRASDDHGHSALMHVKVSPTLHGEIVALIQSKAIPELRTHADVVRDALIHRMVFYRDMLKQQGISTGNLSNALALEMREAELDEIELRMAAWSRIIEKLDARLGSLIEVGDFDSAWHVIDQNGDPEDMSAPFAAKLEAVLTKHRTALNAISARLPQMERVPYDSDVVPLRRNRR
jgi:hypothetical protein